MMRIVDRATGSILLEVPDDEGEKLTDLVEDVQSFQVSELFLDAAEREEVDPSLLARLKEELERSPTLFVGSEPTVADAAFRLSGQVTDHAGTPIGGLVVTAQSKDEEAVAWAFSRPDGTFCLDFATRPDTKTMELLVSARSGLLLLSLELDELGEEDERMDPFQVPTLRGLVLLESGEPLSGGRIEAWSTWSNIDQDGRFVIPVDRLGEELHLEIFARSGQPLGGYWKVSLPKTEPVDVGTKVVPAPSPGWPDSEQPLIAPEFGTDSIFPGVSDHPLS